MVKGWKESKVWLKGLMVLAVALVVFGKSHLESERMLVKDMVFVPKPEFPTLSNRELVADLLLIRAMVYHGVSQSQRDAIHYEWFAILLDTILAFDQKFFDVYLFGAHLLSEQDPQHALRLLENGINQFPDSWRLYSLAGFIAYTNFQDYKKSAEYFHLGGRLPGAPPYLTSLASRHFDRVGMRQMAIEVLKRFAQETDRETVRKAFLERIKDLKKVKNIK